MATTRRSGAHRGPLPGDRLRRITRVDGAMAFYIRVGCLLRPDDVVLDVGCGRGEAAEDPAPSRRQLRILKGRCARVISIDPDGVGADNPCIDEFRPIVARRWPVDDESVDLRLHGQCRRAYRSSRCVLRRVRACPEARMLLRVKTANSLGDAALAARSHPQRLARGRSARSAARTGPERRLPHLLSLQPPAAPAHSPVECGFTAYVHGHAAEPAYLGFSLPTYALGVVWARVAPSILLNTLLDFAERARR